MTKSVVRILIATSLLLSLATASALWSVVQARSCAGMQLPDAEKEDFFTFFHFKEGDTEKHPDGNVISFATGMQGFTVLLFVETSAGNKVKNMRLALPRDFVDDPKWGLFARDMGKSFLRAAVYDQDMPAVDMLAKEIEFGSSQSWTPKKLDASYNGGETKKDVNFLLPGGDKKIEKGQVLIMGENAAPKLPATPSAGYKTFLGKQESFSQKMSHCSLTIQNKLVKDKKYVLLAVQTN